MLGSSSPFYDRGHSVQESAREDGALQQWLTSSYGHPMEFSDAQQGSNTIQSVPPRSYFPVAENQFSFVPCVSFEPQQQHFQLTPTAQSSSVLYEDYDAFSQPVVGNPPNPFLAHPSRLQAEEQPQSQYQQQPRHQLQLNTGNAYAQPTTLHSAPDPHPCLDLSAESTSASKSNFNKLSATSSPSYRNETISRRQQVNSTARELKSGGKSDRTTKKTRQIGSDGRASTVKRTPQISASTKQIKKRRKDDAEQRSESESDDDVEDGAIGGEDEEGGTGRVLLARKPGACNKCKRVKMKCVFPKFSNTCKRCEAGGHQCYVEGRKQRTQPKREWLLAQIRQKDKIIESLLKQIPNPYSIAPVPIGTRNMAKPLSDSNDSNVVAWLERLQTSVRDAGGKAGHEAFNLDDRAKSGTTLDDGDDSDHGSAQNPWDIDEFDTSHADSLDAGLNDDGVTDRVDGPVPSSAFPLGLIANLSLSNSKAKGSTTKGKGGLLQTNFDDDDDVGVANETYFLPGPATNLDEPIELIKDHSPPEIIVHGLVTPEDVDKLFEIFYTYINVIIIPRVTLETQLTTS